MPLRDGRINIWLKCGCLVVSGGVEIWVSSICFQKSNSDWPQQPPTEKVLKFNKIFHDSIQKNYFQNIEIKLNSNAWMTLKSSIVIFQALKPLQSQWPQWPQQPQWPQWPWQPHFIKKITDPDGLIILSTQMTNTSPFLWNGSSKIQFFTNIWHSFCQRLLRPANVNFLKTGW
jgi:hypothetical protein